MPSKFFEIDINQLPIIQDLENKKYTAQEYAKMGQSLSQVQTLMEQGKSGKEILSVSDSDHLRGIPAAYNGFYNAEGGDRIKLDFDDSGQFRDYANGRHRIESARNQGIRYIPAEVSAPNEKVLKQLAADYGSGRDLSKFDPKCEQMELDQERYFPNDDFSPNKSNQENLPSEGIKSMETFKKPFSPAQIPQTPEEAIDAEGKTIKPSSQSDTTTAPKTQEERARDLLSKENLNPERREDLESKYGKLANPSEQFQSQPQESTDRSESRNKLEELRARYGLPDSQADQTPLDRTESGDQSNKEPTQTSPYLGYRGNPNPNPDASEVNGKMEPGNTIGAEKMANLTAKHNEALNNAGQEYRAASDTALNNALAEKYAPKEQPTANSEPQEVNQDGTRS
jgi:hypothetical protein